MKSIPWTKAPIKGVEFKIGPVTAVAANKSAARDLAIESADAALSLDYNPHVVIYRGMAGIAWNTPTGPTYRILWTCRVEFDGRFNGGFAEPADESLNRLVRRMKVHVAQAGWRGGETTADILDHEEDVSFFGRWAEWQNRYAAEYELQIERGVEAVAADQMARQVANNFV